MQLLRRHPWGDLGLISLDVARGIRGFFQWNYFPKRGILHTMKLSIGIVGLPNVGKSTLFRTITKQQVNIANYPFCTIDPNVGVVAVPDLRLDKLAEISKSVKKIPAVVEFYDIAGLVKGAYKGEGLGNQFLSHIRDVKVIVQVLRVFPSEDIIHVEKSVDPLRDLDIINTELIFKDLETVEKRWKKAESEIKTGGKEAAKNFETLKKIKERLDAGRLIVDFANESIVRELQLLTAKKQLCLLNGKPEHISEDLVKNLKERGIEHIAADLETSVDVPSLITAAYRVLDLISFFTTGEDETRAWTIEKGAKAPQAAGAIHTDFEKKFIRAEVVHYDKFMEASGWNHAKQKGWIRLEGKEYAMNDGDITVIRHG